MIYRNNPFYRRIPAVVALLVLLCFADIVSAQQHSFRIGVHTGIQSSLLRYTVVPYTGTFQAVIDEGAISGVSVCFDINPEWSVVFDMELKHDQWSERRGEDPLVEIDMAGRSTLAFPLLLRYQPPIPSVPLYLAAGAALTVTPDNTARFKLSYTGFTEVEGWHTTSSTVDQSGKGINAVVESGIDVAMGTSFSLLLAARYQKPFSNLVAGDRLNGELISIWRLRAALYIRI